MRGGCKGRSLHRMVYRNLHCTVLQRALHCICLLSRPRLHAVTRQCEGAKHLLVEAQPPCAPLCRRRWWRRIWRCCAGTPSPAPGKMLAQLLLASLPWVQAHMPRRSPPPGRLGRPHRVRASGRARARARREGGIKRTGQGSGEQAGQKARHGSKSEQNASKRKGRASSVRANQGYDGAICFCHANAGVKLTYLLRNLFRCAQYCTVTTIP